MTNKLTKLLLMLFVLLTCTQHSHADTFNVATETDLNDAIISFNSKTSGSHTIKFTTDITLTGNLSAINNPYPGTNLTINGQDESNIDENHTLNGGVIGGTSYKMIYIHPNTRSRDIIIERLTLTNSHTNEPAIRTYAPSTSTTLYLRQVTVKDNSSEGTAGLHVGSTSKAHVAYSTFDYNSATLYGGPAIYNAGNTSIYNSTFKSNTATNNTAGAVRNAGTMLVQNSTFTLNSATSGGAISNSGTGILTIRDSTFSGNIATGPSAGTSIYNDNGTISLKSTIIANGNAGADCLTSGGTVTDNGHNLIENDACGLIDGVNNNIVGQDPQLNALAYNGGYTQTMALMPTSPAIDKGSLTFTEQQDQRGVSRNITPPDIGAFELLKQDQFEANNTGATATLLNKSLDMTELTIDDVNWPDEDVFKFHLDDGDKVTIDAYFKHLTCNLNISLYSDEALTYPEEEVAFSNSTTDEEQIVYTAAQSGTYYLEVYCTGFDANSYTLNIQLPDKQICFPVKAKNGNIVMICL